MNLRSMSGIALLLLVLGTQVTTRANSVSIFSGFNVNDPTNVGGPYTDRVGSAPNPVFQQDGKYSASFNYNFGNPYGLSEFAAEIAFDLILSTTGYYFFYIDSNFPYSSTGNAGYSIDGWNIAGIVGGEVNLEAGKHRVVISLLHANVPAISQEEYPTFGAPNYYGYDISFYVAGWGGDPRIVDADTNGTLSLRAYPLLPDTGFTPVVSDTGFTAPMLGVALLGLAAVRPRFTKRTASRQLSRRRNNSRYS